MSGIIGIVSGDLSRWTAFHTCLDALDIPEGWTIKRVTPGANIAAGRNALVEATRSSNVDHLWFLDDDHVFAPDTLKRLLAHKALIVAPLVCRRAAPYTPVMYDWVGDKEYRARWPKETTGTEQVDACGTAGMLIHREVFEEMAPTALEPAFCVGQLDPDGLGEDIYFCAWCEEHNMPILVDLDTRMGHLTGMAVWPDFQATGKYRAEPVGSTGFEVVSVRVWGTRLQNGPWSKWIGREG